MGRGACEMVLDVVQSKSLEMREFFVQRGYPTSLLDAAFSKASQIPRSETLSNSVTNVTDHNRTPPP